MENINLESFDTINALRMNNLFDSCINLKSLDLSSFNTEFCKDYTDMFKNDEDLVIVIDKQYNEKLIDNLPDYVNYINTENIPNPYK